MPLADSDVLTKEQIAEFDTKYGEDQVAIIRRTNRKDPTKLDFEFAIRMPSTTEYQLFRSRAGEKATSSRAQELLIKQILVHPTSEKFNEFLKKWPGLCESTAVTNAVQSMLGLVSDEYEKP